LGNDIRLELSEETAAFEKTRFWKILSGLVSTLRRKRSNNLNNTPNNNITPK